MGEVEPCDNTVRTSLWTNTSSQPIFLRSLELRQVAEFGLEGDVRATAFVRRPGYDELVLAENWNHISDPGTRSVNTSLAPDYTTVNPGDSLRLDTQCVSGGSSLFFPQPPADLVFPLLDGKAVEGAAYRRRFDTRALGPKAIAALKAALAAEGKSFRKA